MLAAIYRMQQPAQFLLCIFASAAYWADSTDRRNTIFVGLSGDTEDRPRVASL